MEPILLLHLSHVKLDINQLIVELIQ